MVTISIAIEAIVLYLFIKSISPQKALFISIVGNAASALLGTIIMAIAMLGWHFSFDILLGGTFSIYNLIANYILMYSGSSLIELFTIKKIFRYSTKQLLIPILIGNAITYAMVGIYKFPQETKQVKEFIGIQQPDEKIISKNKHKKN